MAYLQAYDFNSPDELRTAYARGEAIYMHCPTIEQARDALPILPWDEITAWVPAAIERMYLREAANRAMPLQTAKKCPVDGADCERGVS
jgi:hypothetical protein